MGGQKSCKVDLGGCYIHNIMPFEYPHKGHQDKSSTFQGQD